MTTSTASPLLVDDLGDGVVGLRLNRPQRFNGLEVGLVSQLHAALERIAADRGVRAVVLSGEGKHFCAGADLAGHGVAPGGDGSRSPQDWMAIQQHIATLVLRLRALPQPVVAAVHGAASGGGFALSLAADLCLCAADARFNVAFVKIGLSGCDMGVSWLLPRLVGARRAFELMLTGRFVEAPEAAAIGLVTEVVEPDELVARAVEKARQIAANSPYGIRMTKEVMWSQLEISSLRAGLDLENRTQVTAAMTEDHREAVQAFLDKRPPVFGDR